MMPIPCRAQSTRIFAIGFLYYCDRYRNPQIFVPPVPNATAVKGGGIAMRPPMYKREMFFSALCSERINSSLYFAGTLDLVPISSQPLYISLFHLKLKRALANPDFREGKKLPPKRKARFSALSWQVVTEVVTLEALARRSVQDVLRYKQESADLSAKFRAYLFRLEAGLSLEPWDSGSREEIEKVVRAEVLPEVQKVREGKALIWQKLFSEAIKATFSEAALKAAAPVLTMYVIPGTSYLSLICYSTAALVGGLLPKLMDARSEEAAMRKNALFFVLKV
jgi:hypothetical protein